jgi:hypothetical protein
MSARPISPDDCLASRHSVLNAGFLYKEECPDDDCAEEEEEEEEEKKRKKK